MLLLTASSSPLPDMGAVGTAAQGMRDQTAALYFMAVLLVALLIERGLTGWRSGAAAEKMRASHAATTERLAGSIDRLAQSIQSGDAQAMANMAVIQHEMASAARDRASIARNLKDYNRSRTT